MCSCQCRNEKEDSIQHIETHPDQDERANEFKRTPITRYALEVLKPAHGKCPDGNRHSATECKSKQQHNP